MTTHAPTLRAGFSGSHEMVIDNFAGGGGASTGIERALGRPIDVAINHSPEAIALHSANHPRTQHYCENILEVDPKEVCGSRPVAFAWFSPDCTHFSKAKGCQPVKKEIRGLAWVVTRWAQEVRPRVIVLENVEEFQTWGPLDDNGRPLREQLGTTFQQWLGTLTQLGYRTEFRTLTAADFGAPTTRRRLFLIARCDGQPIIWPEPTHGKSRGVPWRSAAEILDWSIPTPSIFGRSRALAPATMRRIASGLQRYVLASNSPMRPAADIMEPFIVRHGHYSTITGAGLYEGCGAGTFRGQRLRDPLATVCATNDKHLVCPIVTKHYGGVVGHKVDRPLGTVTARDHHALSAALLTQAGVDDARISRFDDVCEFLREHAAVAAATRQQPLPGFGSAAPLGEIRLRETVYRISDIGMRMLQPRELFRAQGFPEAYVIDPIFRGRPLSKTAQIAAAGNSVCPQVAEAIVRSNLRELMQGAA